MKKLFYAFLLGLLAACSTPNAKYEVVGSGSRKLSREQAEAAFKDNSIKKNSTGLDDPLTPINVPLPDFPRELQKEGNFGRVLAAYLITYDGSVQDVRIGEAPSPVMAKLVSDAIYKWKYKPPMKDGKPTEAWTKITVIYARK